jgi:hypothetical protein
VSDITSQDIALFARVLSKIEDSFMDRLTPEELRAFKKLQTLQDSLRVSSERKKGDGSPDRQSFDAGMKAASALLKFVSTREPEEEDKGTKARKVEWEVSGFDDEGDCDAAAKACGGMVKKGYDRDKSKFLRRDIDEGDLGVLYETNLTTEGDKYSLFFKYVRESEGKARMVGVAIGSHSGTGNRYYVVKKDGGKSKNQVSATKKL